MPVAEIVAARSIKGSERREADQQRQPRLQGSDAGADRGFARNHFGGTTESYETKVRPRYLHIDEREVGGNFAGDDAHVDLERVKIVWGED